MPAISKTPLLSFIVLSYNYEKYIGVALESILRQTIQDFEVIVVDDASTDNSRSVIQRYQDPRVRLYCNDVNLGGARSYNRAVEAAQGDWLVNLDADDWIAPEKSAKQLAAIDADAQADIIGTHVTFFDEDGNLHPDAAKLEEYTNSNLDLNLLESWIGRNTLCRSSTMVRRSAHLRIGLDDPDMVRAPDYELWTRALRMGCRFRVVPEQLTSARVQSKGVTHGDPLGAMLEKTWIAIHNLRPHAEAMSAWPSFERIIRTVAYDPNLAGLNAKSRYRLFAALFMETDFKCFADFCEFLNTENLPLEIIGKRALAFSHGVDSGKDLLIEKLMNDIDLYLEARDYWKGLAHSAPLGSIYLTGQRLAKYLRRTLLQLYENKRSPS